MSVGKARHTLTHTFVEHIPETLDEGVLYVSMTFATAMHLCCCGCGREVVTPLSPTGWKLIFDGETVSLSPSIGNWSLPCRSHYFIRGDRVQWSGDMPEEAIRAGRLRDQRFKATYYRQEKGGDQPVDGARVLTRHESSLFGRFLAWLRK